MQFCELTGASADRVSTEQLLAKVETRMEADSLPFNRLPNTSRPAVGTSPLQLVPFSPMTRMRPQGLPEALLSLHQSPRTAAPELSMAGPPLNLPSPPPVPPRRNPPKRRAWRP